MSVNDGAEPSDSSEGGANFPWLLNTPAVEAIWTAEDMGRFEGLRTQTAMLVGVRRPVMGFRVLLWREQVRLGSGRQCHVFLPSKSVSPHHATLTRKGSAYELIDATSLNGSYVNGTPAASTVLRDGDVIQFADCRFVYLEGKRAPQDAR